MSLFSTTEKTDCNANEKADCNATYPTCRRLGDTRLPPTIVLLGTPDFFGSPCLFQLSRPSGSSRLSALWTLSPPDIIQARGTQKSSPAQKREEPSSVEVNLLNKDIQRFTEVLTIREAEIVELKETNGWLWLSFNECNEQLTRFMLPAPRRSFWSRLRRKE